ncbi:MAG: HPr(Ser) kinase/phosphatase [Aerococcaceae bacterium]|nr:HPr(Ser) kinase/phosphatase [Aerococcaceae bacterium]
MGSVTVNDVVKMLDVRFLAGEEFGERQITSSEIARPGLVLSGYRGKFPRERMQLIGQTEVTYMESKTAQELVEAFEWLFIEETPTIILSRGLEAPQALIEVAVRKGIPVLQARSKTSRVFANITNYLEGQLAERLSKHGVFVEVFGMGVLLVGGSGVGKSETALDLIQRGHRLIADDRVELFMIDELTLIGEAPEILQNLIEIRGLGIIDIQTLYGVSSVRRSKRLEVIIELVLDDGTVEYDRLGSQREYEQIFEVNIPKIRIPVKMGRSLSVIIESAAMNFRANQMGYNATEAFNRKLEALITANREG